MNVIIPKMDHRADPKDIKAQIDDLVVELDKFRNVVVIGSSAGGFWADYLAAKYYFKVVLINPSLQPATTYSKFGIHPEYFPTYAEIEATSEEPRLTAVAFSGEIDDVIPTAIVKRHYKYPIMLKNEGHRIQDLTPIFDMVHSMI
jgi:predicted esterase YcpF (UPF0227 family)